jgi:hypothetical protein
VAQRDLGVGCGLNGLAQAGGAVRRHGGIDDGKDGNYMNFYPNIAQRFDGGDIFFSERMRCSLRFY